MGASVIGKKMPTNSPVTFAPSGIFEIKRLWQKGISGAGMYIYVEDQSFTSTEIFKWLNTALQDNPIVKVVLLTGAQDPTAPNPDALLKAMRRNLNDILLKGLSRADIDNRLGFFMRSHTTVHTKTTLVYDNCALVGSANMMRRSLYTDFEHSIGFMDEAGTAVASYRRALFNAHLGAPGAPNPMVDVARWFALPYWDTPGVRNVGRMRLPFTKDITLTPKDELLVDEIMDVDSRDPWGSSLITTGLSSVLSGI
jgi:phosphatidylserine/phosphatidylglycerophosphate/cardiolipin synthase-like enzyme